MSRMACACTSVNAKRSMRLVLASFTLADAFMSATISSMCWRAFRRPSRMWTRSLAFLSSKMLRRVTTSSLKSRKAWSISRRPMTDGLPLWMASMFMENEVCKVVSL
ncbi:MAG: hypothetical protein BWX71_02669 [Deltaproteobacteria bacterium ADurb.Bin072]|nr:MAG: hypothetical protein BWX71_02669 [Deltaproteobacteria bacterium ADurb.Bin072]